MNDSSHLAGAVAEKSKHTPGPWAVCMEPPNTYWLKGRSIGAADPRDARRVCDVFSVLPYPHMGEMFEANARLIAAAPDLLGALKMLYAETDDYQRINKLGGHDNQCMRWAREAIAKAEGQ